MKSKMVGALVDKKGKVALAIYCLNDDEAEKIVKEKIFLAFKKGILLIGWRNGELVTIPPISELIEKGLI
ncbi:MAG: hypothetical protein OH338_04975 [Candidatus Parvarchaeota archaeon]|nr:hypothetical protein [Candidatus Parvarchaeum tengchongense]